MCLSIFFRYVQRDGLLDLNLGENVDDTKPVVAFLNAWWGSNGKIMYNQVYNNFCSCNYFELESPAALSEVLSNNITQPLLLFPGFK